MSISGKGKEHELNLTLFALSSTEGHFEGSFTRAISRLELERAPKVRASGLIGVYRAGQARAFQS